MRRLVVAATALLALPCAGAAAQNGSFSPARVRWKAANLLVYPDSTRGVLVWLATNAYATIDGQPARQELHARFAPDSVFGWVVMTRQLLALKAPPLAGDTASYVASGFLRDESGLRLAVARMREGSGLRDGARLLVVPAGAAPFVFDLAAGELDTLLAAAEAAAGQSRLAPPATKAAEGQRRDESQVELLREGRLTPLYPDDLKRAGIEGEVWAEFVVDETGRVDLSTFRPHLSDDSGFERAVTTWLGNARFRPATVEGRPVRQRVYERFTFQLTR